jgi:hypothetical protein
LRDWRQRGIDHEEVQSIKTAERLGLLKKEVQAFFWQQRRRIPEGRRVSRSAPTSVPRFMLTGNSRKP